MSSANQQRVCLYLDDRQFAADLRHARRVLKSLSRAARKLCGRHLRFSNHQSLIPNP